jgi:hypothetical protein
MMPAKSEKQKRFMDAAAHNPSFAKAAGIPVSVAKEFSASSKGKTFGTGGPKSRADVQAINKPKTNHGESGFFSKGGDMKKMNMGGYADGGLNMVRKGDKMVPDFAADGVGKMKKGGMTKSGMKHEDVKMDKGMMQKAVNKHEGRLHKGQPMTKLAGGGTFRTSANGVAKQGKTKGTMIKMNKGGMPC